MLSKNFKQVCVAAFASASLLFGTFAQAEVERDFSNPKATLTTLAKAMDAGDAATAKAAISGNEQQMNAVDGEVELMKGMKDLQNASKEKFGEIPAELQDAGMEKMMAQVKEATVKEDGDTAVVTMPEEPRPEGMPAPTPEQAAEMAKQRELKLKKIDGDWKLDAESMMQGQEVTEQQLKQFTLMSKVASDTAKEVRDGKHANYQAAMEAMGQKMMAAMMGGMNPEMAPVQEPMTAPAPAPAPEAAPAPAPAE